MGRDTTFYAETGEGHSPRGHPRYLDDANLSVLRVVGRVNGLNGYPGTPDAPERSPPKSPPEYASRMRMVSSFRAS